MLSSLHRCTSSPSTSRPTLCSMSESTPLESPDLGGSTLLEERTSDYDDGDHERFAHYVEKAKIVESAVMGTPVTALCGKKWIPGRDPSKFPVCPECQEIHASLARGGE